MGVGRDKVPVIVVGLLGVVLLGGIIAVRLLPSSAGQGTNAALAHDPDKPRRGPRAYQESIEGQRYVNRDLGIALSGPKDWSMALGTRTEEEAPYEGLLVKMQPPGPPDEETLVRPLVSVVKRSLPSAGGGDPLDYIRQQLLDSKKTVTEPPALVEVRGKRMGRVGYEMPSGRGKIRIVQHVYLRPGEAIIVSAMAPSGAFGKLSGTFEEVLKSLGIGL